MAEVIKMPKMSDTMTEGVIAAWHKKVGDTVKSGDILAEVETDKATMELESYEDGTLLYIGPKEQDSVPVDGVLAIIGKQGENIDSLLKEISNGGSAAPKEEKSAPAPAAAPAPAEEKEENIDTSSIDANVITMPKMSDTMQEGTIVAWHKKVGDKVKSGDLLAEVETDKATMELESYEDGTLLYIGVEEGNAVAVDAIIAIIGKEGADYKALLSKGSKSKAAPAAETKPEPSTHSEAPKQAEATSAAASDSDERVKISPLARRIAKDKGIDPKELRGSGEGGRIIKKDIENFTPSAKPAAAAQAQKGAPAVTTAPVGQESFSEVNVSQMRKTIARRLAESKFSAPHFYVTMEINMDRAIEARKTMNEYAGTKISFNDLVIKATAAALRKHPKVNSSWRGDKIRYNEHVHIGMAVAVEEGLLVPVIRFADSKSLSQISAEAKDFGAKAKNKQLQPSDWEGNTFTISNLGMFGVEDFTAIINPPDACILAVGGIKETVIVKNGQMQVGNVMKVTLSCDHRVVDGALAAGFLQTLKGLLEDPVRILV
jgi:pyruvate dehydrogenase E2 component (dihydrolipoamide acetyltransferase)